MSRSQPLRAGRPPMQSRLIAGRAALCAALIATPLLAGGCAVVAVADAAVTVGATVVKTGVKATGAVVNAMIPNSEPAARP